MRLLRPIVIATTGLMAGLLTGTSLVIGTAAGPASAHTHPTPIELDSPAVVRVETYAQVSISLIEHNKVGTHIGLLQRTYTPLLAAGSGFAADPSGAVVTSAKLIDVDLKRAETFAVNKIFNERYGDNAPLPSDPFAKQTLPENDPIDRLNGRLQRCYAPNATDETGGCVVFSSLVVKVLPFVSDQKQFGNLTATVVSPKTGSDQTSGNQPGDVVVLKVGASSMPTVDLARSTDGVAAFSILGFGDVPANATSLRRVDGHFTAAGSADVKRDEDYDMLGTGLANGLRGGPVVAEKGQVVGFLADGKSSDGKDNLELVGPAAIRAALSAAGIDPHRGPTDTVYENAMHNYKNKLYTPAIPSLAQTLKLYPGHALAAEQLADANRKKGTAEEAITPVSTQRTSPGMSVGLWYTVVWVAIALMAILIAVLVILLIRRGRSRNRKPPGGGPSGFRPPRPREPDPNPANRQRSAGKSAGRASAERRNAQERRNHEQETVFQARMGGFPPTEFQQTEYQQTEYQQTVPGSYQATARIDPDATRQLPLPGAAKPRPNGRTEPTVPVSSAPVSPAPVSPGPVSSTPVSPAPVSPAAGNALGTCSRCGKDVLPAQLFCDQCGQLLR